MAFECYDCVCYVGNDRYEFVATDYDDAVNWCCEMFYEQFDNSKFVGAYCMYIDTEYGPAGFTFGFYRDGSSVASDNYFDRLVFENAIHGYKLVDVNDLVEWVMSISEV